MVKTLNEKISVCFSSEEKRSRKELMISLFTSGHSFKEIGERLGINWMSARASLARWGYRTTKEKLSETDKAEALRLYTDNVPIKEIAKHFKCSRAPIYSYLKSIGGVRPPGESIRKSPINHDYFSEIDTEDKAYLLGFLFADGYNYQVETKKAVSLKLAEKDISVVEMFRDFINPGRTIKIYNRSNKNPNWQDIAYLNIHSEKLSDDLAKWGCVQGKTHTLTFPENLPQHIVRHFIRGYFDGDGYASKLRFEVVSTEAFLLKLQEIMMKEIGLAKTKLHQRHKERDNSIRTLIYGGTNVMKSIYDYLYTNATYYLPRKKSAFNIN